MNDSGSSENEMAQSFTPFGGKYMLGDKIGQGAFGKVYKLRKTNNPEDFAVKVSESRHS